MSGAVVHVCDYADCWRAARVALIMLDTSSLDALTHLCPIHLGLALHAWVDEPEDIRRWEVVLLD